MWYSIFMSVMWVIILAFVCASAYKFKQNMHKYSAQECYNMFKFYFIVFICAVMVILLNVWR